MADNPPPRPRGNAAPRNALGAPLQQQRLAPSIPWAKVVIVGVLLFSCFLLAVAAYSLEVYLADQILERKLNRRGDTPKDPNGGNSRHSEDASSQRPTANPGKSQTVRMSLPAQESDLHSHRTRHQGKHNGRHLAESYWNQVGDLMQWQKPHNDDVSVFPTSTSSSTADGSGAAPTPAEQTRSSLRALRLAAEHGHPEAQLHLANALAGGFWTVSDIQPKPPTLAVESSVGDTMYEDIGFVVSDSWLVEASAANNSNSIHASTAQSRLAQQQTQAWLLWRMSANAGNVHAMMTIAHQMEQQPLSRKTQPTDKASIKETPIQLANRKCQAILPYYAQAAHTVIDQLSVHPHSRGHLLPARDKHVLYKIWQYGTGGTLDAENRPDQAPETLQFYHVRASTVGNADASSAAYTLGQYYRTGAQGAQQNLTLAVSYYELAASQEHWEAAGQAGWMYLWGIGVEQDTRKAHEMFVLGAPFQYTGCLDRYRQKQKKKTEKIFLCDDASLTGLGLLHVLGLPMIIGVDIEHGEEFLELAKDQGNSDAAYYLAMMKLGWKTHFKSLDSVQENGQSMQSDVIFTEGSTHPKTAEYKSALSDLTTAASKSHILARHRLAMMYETGIKIPNAKAVTTTSPQSQNRKQFIVPQDCQKAASNYKWIVDTASHGARMRRAYKQYVAGETSYALRNYLAIAATGHDVAQLNAAFLLEQGECLGLDATDCAKASVRLYKAASARGSGEASLRVGDFYYYGRFRPKRPLLSLPFGWIQYLLYPEEHILPHVWQFARQQIIDFSRWEPLSILAVGSPQKSAAKKDEPTCMEVSSSTEGTCEADFSTAESDDLDTDLAMASQFYQLAAERNGSPRAHFNLGFLYQWGLGLKQDFPLAKRQYDLAVSSQGLSQEADVPVTLALKALSTHEYFVKLYMTWKDSFQDGDNEDRMYPTSDGQPATSQHLAGSSSPSSKVARRTKADVLLSHLLSWESLIILVLTIILSKLFHIRRTQR